LKTVEPLAGGDKVRKTPIMWRKGGAEPFRCPAIKGKKRPSPGPPNSWGERDRCGDLFD